MIQNIRTLRAPAVGLGMRQYVSSAQEELSKNLIMPMVIAVLVTVGVVSAMSQFFSWQISQQKADLEQMQSFRMELGSENISLLAVRARLASPDKIEAEVAERLQLHRPGQSQLHTL